MIHSSGESIPENLDRHSKPDVVLSPEFIEAKLLLLDKLIDWEASLTDRMKLREMLLSGEQLRIKFGADITASTLHLGHAVNLRAMRHLQDLGHKVVFLLGGFTTLVGDPADRLEQRTPQGQRDIEENKLKFIAQIKSVLLVDNPHLLEVRDNVEWWGSKEKMGRVTLEKFFKIISKLTVTQLLGRDMFQKRTEKNLPIYVSEFLYPVLQGYDSVEMESDLTFVGSDQMFNEKMAWVYQEAVGQKKQGIFCTKITQGLDGKGKQSKSREGSYVGLEFAPQQKFNAVMLLADELLGEWFTVYTDLPTEEISRITQQEKNSLELKKKLAFEIVRMYHGVKAAEGALAEFEQKRFKKLLPENFDKIISVSRKEKEWTIKDIIAEKIGRKMGELRDALSRNAVTIIHPNSEGGYTEEVCTLESIRTAVSESEIIIRWGKNNWYKIVLSE